MENEKCKNAEFKNARSRVDEIVELHATLRGNVAADAIREDGVQRIHGGAWRCNLESEKRRNRDRNAVPPRQAIVGHDETRANERLVRQSTRTRAKVCSQPRKSAVFRMPPRGAEIFGAER